MSSKPILMTGPMVRAIAAGRKTQTRRVVKPQPDAYGVIHASGDSKDGNDWKFFTQPIPGVRLMGELWYSCPYGQPGDLLWVRETWAHVPRTAYGSLGNQDPTDEDMAAIYKSSFDRADGGFRWRSSIHMPRWASRLTLRITDVRINRLNVITDAECRAEGIRRYVVSGPDPDGLSYQDWRTPFKKLWDFINAKRGYPWASDPWVWVLEFEAIRRNVDMLESLT